MNKLRKEALIYTLLVTVIAFLMYCLVCFILRSKTNNTFEQGDFRSYFPNTETKVVVYGTSWCRACAKTRDYLKNKNVNYIDYDIDYDIDSVEAAKMQYLQLGGKAVPLLLIGDRRLEGFNAKVISEALAQLPEIETDHMSR